MNLAIIGYGSSANYFHLPIIKTLSEIKLKAVFDVSEKNREIALLDGFESSFNIDFLESKLKELKIDIAVICSPNIFHYEQSKICLELKINVIVDKPACLKLDDFMDLINISEKNQVIFTVFHNRKFDNDFIKVLEIINTNEIGNIKRIDLSVAEWGVSNKFASQNFNPKWREYYDYGGGMFFDWSPHLIDKLLIISKNILPINVNGIIRSDIFTNKCDDSVIIHLNWETHTARIIISALDFIPMEKMRVCGDKGTVTVNGDDNNGYIQLKTSTIEKKYKYSNNIKNSSIIYTSFIKAILNKDENYCIISKSQLINIMKLIELINKVSIKNF